MKMPDQIIRRVEDKVIETCLRAQTLYGRAFELPAIEWNLRGQRAACAHGRDNRIRINPVLLAENTEDFIAQTVPHEIAHLINHVLHGPRVQAHGALTQIKRPRRGSAEWDKKRWLTPGKKTSE